MKYDIRRISHYVGTIHSRYFIDSNGIIYTSLGGNTNRITIDGVRYNTKGFAKSHISGLSLNNNPMIELPYGKNYYLLYDGTIIKRLSTRLTKNGEVDVCLTTYGGRDRGQRWQVSRLMGYVFLGLKIEQQEKEIHHIDQDRTNNKIENLLLLDREEHRGKKQYYKYHK